MSTESGYKNLNKFALFCQTFSIRGIYKIYHANSKFEKVLWSCFLLTMSLILISTLIFLVQNYLQYTTAWHSSTLLNRPSAFPSLTICSQNPFSKKANKIWSKNQIISPSNLRDNLTLISLNDLQKEDISILSNLRLYDLFSTYYMNLSPGQAYQLGHSREIVKYCIIMKKHDIIVAEKCQVEHDNLKIKLFSHQDYFNCYTFEGNYEYTKDLSGIILIMETVKTTEIPELSNSFLVDMLQRGEGMKIAIHEPYALPDMENKGFNLHPGKMNSIVYSQFSWKRVSTPKVNCRDNNANQFLNDLNREFIYTHGHCINGEVQQLYINHCKCMLSIYPRPIVPNSTIPYCLKLENTANIHKIIERFHCVGNLFDTVTKTMKDSENCHQRCQYSTYETTTSLTEWIADEQKFNKLQNLYRSYKKIRENITLENKRALRKILLQSLNEKYSNIPENSKLHLDKSTSLTYISVFRKNFDINLLTEKLVLDFNTLLSRMGGLSSLCIGLTAASVTEFVEYFYQICCASNSPPSPGNMGEKKKRKKRRKKEKSQRQQTLDIDIDAKFLRNIIDYRRSGSGGGDVGDEVGGSGFIDDRGVGIGIADNCNHEESYYNYSKINPHQFDNHIHNEITV